MISCPSMAAQIHQRFSVRENRRMALELSCFMSTRSKGQIFSWRELDRGPCPWVCSSSLSPKFHRTDDHPTVSICKWAPSDSICLFQVLHQNGVQWRFRNLVYELLADPIHASRKNCWGCLTTSWCFSTPYIFF